MNTVVEKVLPSERSSFRFLRWQRSVSDVEIVGPGGVCSRITGRGSELHMHPEAEITLILEGEGRTIIGDDIGRFCGPELLILGAAVPHCWEAEGESRGYAVQMSIDEKQPLNGVPEWEALRQLWDQAGRGLRAAGPSAAALEPLFIRMIDAGPIGRLSALLDLVSRLAGSLPEMTSLSGKRYSQATWSPHFKAVQEAISTITLHYSEELTLGDIVETTGLSRATFCRAFKQYTNRTFVEFLNEVRVDAVCQQLTKTDKRVSDIAYSCGFANLSNFNRAFRVAKGLSPVAYRRAVRSDP